MSVAGVSLTVSEPITFRVPTLKDGMSVYQLVAKCPPLDRNSSYCNLLQSSHFAATSVAACRDKRLVGFVSGYLVPDKPNTLFIWQVAVADEARGKGVASRMIHHILDRPCCQALQYVETSITPGNKASWALFERLAKNLGADLSSSPWMDSDVHFAGQHDSEHLVRLGPLR